jgi:hypothetical protein
VNALLSGGVRVNGPLRWVDGEPWSLRPPNGMRVTGGRVPGRQAGPGRAGCGPRPKAAIRSCSCPSEPRARATGVSRASVRVNAPVGRLLWAYWARPCRDVERERRVGTKSCGWKGRRSLIQRSEVPRRGALEASGGGVRMGRRFGVRVFEAGHPWNWRQRHRGSVG